MADILFTGEVHPVADLFPMLADDELAELAEDVAARGLLQPIVLDTEGQLIDGRNRLAACRKAGVEPTFTIYDGDDPAGYALAVNIARRHLTTGARAVLAAQAGRLNGKSIREIAGGTDLFHSRINEANLVLDWAPALVSGVVAGVTPLSKAVEEARAAKRDAEALEAKLARLQANAEDLAALVADEQLGVDDAVAALVARENEAKRKAEEEASRLEEQAQRERLAHQQALGRWSEANDHIVAALSWAKSHQPPADIPDNFPSVKAVIDRLRTLIEITDNWET